MNKEDARKVDDLEYQVRCLKGDIAIKDGQIGTLKARERLLKSALREFGVSKIPNNFRHAG